MNESITIVPCLATCTVNKYKSKGQFSYKQKSNNFVRKEMWGILNHPIIVSGRQVTRLLYKRVSETYFGGNSGGHVFFALPKIFRLIRIIMWVFFNCCIYKKHEVRFWHSRYFYEYIFNLLVGCIRTYMYM